ncbi:hypothetical protein HanIR_Chr12g0578071 [Helianthus annuus]|nr:hypothetical protein HanIR_Chr12g0578071 [Helianthus annuus]
MSELNQTKNMKKHCHHLTAAQRQLPEKKPAVLALLFRFSSLFHNKRRRQ